MVHEYVHVHLHIYLGEAYFFPSVLPLSPVVVLLTIAEDSEPQEGQVALPLDRVPAQVWVTFGYQHGAALEATASQVRHHLNTQTHARAHMEFDLVI